VSLGPLCGRVAGLFYTPDTFCEIKDQVGPVVPAEAAGGVGELASLVMSATSPLTAWGNAFLSRLLQMNIFLAATMDAGMGAGSGGLTSAGLGGGGSSACATVRGTDISATIATHGGIVAIIRFAGHNHISLAAKMEVGFFFTPAASLQVLGIGGTSG
jgi:hypothetical protein